MDLRRRIKSFGFAFKGLAELLRTQPNARIHLLASVVVVAAAAYFHVTTLEWVSLTLCVAGVIAMEALNTAIEHLTDLASPDFHPLAGKAKDVAAGAVLVMAMGAIVVGAFIFGPHIWALFF